MKRAVLYAEKEIVIEEISLPQIACDEVLVRTKISTTCGTDVKTYMRGYPLLKPPHPFGHEFSGVLEEVGSAVKGFNVGDRVAVHNSAPCNECYFCKKGDYSMCENLLFNRGAYAEFVKVPGKIVRQNMFVMPDAMSYKTASLLEPLSCAVYGIDLTPIQLGDLVVINGAGPIGLMFARLAVLRGAKVVITDMVDSRLDLALKLGVWKTVNLTNVEDSVQTIIDLTDNQRGADIVIEATGLIGVWNSSVQMVRKGGFVLLFGGTKSGSVLEVDATRMHYSQITLKGVFHTTPRHVAIAFELLKQGVIVSEDFIQNEFGIDDLETAILQHAHQEVIKNCIVYK